MCFDTLSPDYSVTCIYTGNGLVRGVAALPSHHPSSTPTEPISVRIQADVGGLHSTCVCIAYYVVCLYLCPNSLQYPCCLTRERVKKVAAANYKILLSSRRHKSLREFPASSQATIAFSVDPFPSLQPRQQVPYRAPKGTWVRPPSCRISQPWTRRSGGDLATLRYRYLWPWQVLIGASPDLEVNFLLSLETTIY